MVDALVEVNFGVVMDDEKGHKEYFCDISDKYMDMALFVFDLNRYHIDYQQAKEKIEAFKMKKASEKKSDLHT